MDPLVEARPGLAGAIATATGTGEDGILDAVERFCVIDRVSRERASETPAAAEARAEQAMKRLWPGWK